MFTLIKLKKLEKHYVVYQEKIYVAKADERDGVDIPVKGNKEGTRLCIFSSVSQCVQP